MTEQGSSQYLPTLPMETTNDMFAIAKSFAQAHVLGAKNDAEGVLALKVVQEIGIVAASEKYNIMMGNLSKKASAICSDFIKAGGRYKIVQRDAEAAVLVASYGDTENMTFSFSWEDAQNEPFVYAGGPDSQEAQLRKPVDQRKLKSKYATPRSRMQMLWARIVSDMGNALCPTCCEGLYPPEVAADFDERSDAGARSGGEREPLSAEEVVRRAHNVTAEAEEVEPQPPQDATTCPVLGSDFDGKPWRELDDATLNGAMAYEGAEVTPAHKAAIRLVLEERKGGAE